MEQRGVISVEDHKCPADLILNNIAIACYLLDSNGNFLYVNRKAEMFFEMDKKNMIGKNVWKIFPESRSTHCFISINDAIRNKQVSTYEYISAVSQTWISLTATPANGGAIVMFTEIEEVKATKKELLEEQRRHKTAQEVGRMGYFERYLDQDLFWSDELYRIHGLKPQSEKVTLEKVFSYIHPDDQNSFMQLLNEGIEKNEFVEIRNRIIRKDGEVRILHRLVQFLKDENGHVNRIYGTVQDITDQVRTDLILDSVNEVCFELDQDFNIKYANKRAYQFWNKNAEQVLGKNMWVAFPEDWDTRISELMYEAFEQKKQVLEEVWCPVVNKWILLNINPSPTGLIVLHFDMTEQIKAREKVQQQQQKIKESQELLQSVFDTSLIDIAVLKAVRNESGVIEDFQIQMVNKEIERGTGRTDLAGKLYAKTYPGVKQMGLFDVMLKVVETGKPEQIEYKYHHDGFQKWFSSMFVKMEDGLVSTNQDITARKQAEQERANHYILLQQAEAVAGMGSWDYDLQTKNFIWSAGMYKIFELKKGQKVHPRIYQQYATEKSKITAANVVNNIKKGIAFTETLEIAIGKNVKIISIKATAVIDAYGKPGKVVGADVDITTQVKLHDEKNQLEGKYYQLEASQKEKILQANMDTQERERKRIAESLHNGLGQLLYGVKLSMEQLTYDNVTTGKEKFNESKIYIDRLIFEAIKESRRISHELTPVILEDFGLKEAIMDINRQFSGSLVINCEFIGLQRKLSRYLEITIYRTIQELMMNIVKHAQATEAIIRVDVKKTMVNLSVQDNGIPFSNDFQHKGIGLI
ncbi:MAG: hypothetical protein JWR67_2126, partial [Mucilaginibacter sp.]|nr:hypothetical protein [Mucilaginibacter sp.]